MENIENLFKHNICFTPVNEDRTSFIGNGNFSISVAYISKNIMLKKINIRHVKDLLDQIDPFLYHLASKYLENKGNNAYEAFFQVDFSIGDPNKNHVYSNVKKIYTHERFDDEFFDENISFLEKYSENTRTFFESQHFR